MTAEEVGMGEKRYELHVWYNRWHRPKERGGLAQWMWNKVVLRYEQKYDRTNQIDRILRNEWWHRDRLIPFRDVLRMERQEADK